MQQPEVLPLVHRIGDFMKNNKKKLYLHIGTLKTGTTAIQAFCYRNREMLAEDGIYYPTKAVHSGERFDEGTYPQAGNAADIARMDTPEEISDAILNLMGDEDVTLISSEAFVHFCHKKMGQIINNLKNKSSDLQLIIIVYIRNQADYFESFYREFVQGSYLTASIEDAYHYLITGDFGKLNKQDKELLEDIVCGCNYYNWISDISANLDHENIFIRNYDELMQEKRDIITDFFEIMHLKIDDKYVREERLANPSIGVELLEAKRLTNTLALSEYDQRIHDYFMLGLRTRLNEDKRHGKTSLLTHDERCSIWAKYKEDNRKIAEMFFGGNELFRCPLEKEIETIDIKKYIDDSILMLSSAIYQASKDFFSITKKMYAEYWLIERKRRSEFFVNQMIISDVDIVKLSEKLMDSKLVGWGAGKCCDDLIGFVKEFYPIKYVCDKDENKWGRMISGDIKIISPSELLEMGNVVIVVFSYNESIIESIKHEIQNMGEYKCISACDWASYVNKAD